MGEARGEVGFAAPRVGARRALGLVVVEKLVGAEEEEEVVVVVPRARCACDSPTICLRLDSAAAMFGLTIPRFSAVRSTACSRNSDANCVWAVREELPSKASSAAGEGVEVAVVGEEGECCCCCCCCCSESEGAAAVGVGWWW